MAIIFITLIFFKQVFGVVNNSYYDVCDLATYAVFNKIIVVSIFSTNSNYCLKFNNSLNFSFQKTIMWSNPKSIINKNIWIWVLF